MTETVYGGAAQSVVSRPISWLAFVASADDCDGVKWKGGCALLAQQRAMLHRLPSMSACQCNARAHSEKHRLTTSQVELQGRANAAVLSL